MKKLFLSIAYCSLFSLHAETNDEKILLRSKSTPGGGLQIELEEGVDFGVTILEKRRIFEELIEAPEKVLERNCANLESYEIGNIDSNLFYAESKKFPLGFLHECGDCGLSRFSCPSRRKEFENGVIKAVNSLPIQKSECFIYTSFGPGYLFSDVVLLSKLVREGYKNFTINLIDIDYASLIPLFKNTKQGVICDGISYKPYNLFIQLLDWVKSTANEKLFNFVDPGKDAWLRMHAYRFAQFLDWFKRNDIVVKLYIYGDVKAYIKDCELNSAAQSDLLVGMDFTDEFTNSRKVWNDLARVSACIRDNRFYCLLYNVEMFDFKFSMQVQDRVKGFSDISSKFIDRAEILRF